MKYRKKPIVIEAFIWLETRATFEGLEKIGLHSMSHTSHRDKPDEIKNLRIKTLEGTMKVNRGDWIIKGVKGEFYPCKPDIFEATYELAYTDILREQNERAG